MQDTLQEPSNIVTNIGCCNKCGKKSDILHKEMKYGEYIDYCFECILMNFHLHKKNLESLKKHELFKASCKICKISENVYFLNTKGSDTLETICLNCIDVKYIKKATKLHCQNNGCQENRELFFVSIGKNIFVNYCSNCVKKKISQQNKEKKVIDKDGFVQVSYKESKKITIQELFYD